MLKNILTILLVIGLLILIAPFSFGVFVISGCKYSYIDTQGNKGIADRCDIDIGGLFCYKNDKIIQVIEFEKEKEGK